MFFQEYALQRILPRGEIESLDHTSIPRVRLPQRISVFADRAARLRKLAPGNPISGYLLLMAGLADAQHEALAAFPAPAVPQERISMAQAHGMPPLQAMGGPRDPAWRDALDTVLRHVAQLEQAPPQAVDAAAAVRRRLRDDPGSLEAQADALLAERDDEADGAAAPFIMAGLQVYWTALAAQFDEQGLPVVSPFGVCPLCGSLPVASVVRVGGQADACRYLCCSLCSTEWHLVRVTCSHCQGTKEIAYHAIEGGPEGIKAESCDECHSYRKIFYQEKDFDFEAVADDLATLPLDVLMGEAGYSRASGNPLLWQPSQGSAETGGD